MNAENASMLQRERRRLPGRLIRTALVGVICSVAAFAGLRHHERMLATAHFKELAGRRLSNTEHAVEHRLMSLDVTRAFLRSSQQVESEEFTHFVETILNSVRGMQTLLWASHGADDGPCRVLYIEPSPHPDLSVNTNLKEREVFAAAIGRANATRQAAMVGPYSWREDTPMCVAICLPVLDTSKALDSPRNVLPQGPRNGFLVGIFALDGIFQDALGALGDEHTQVSLVDLPPNEDGSEKIFEATLKAGRWQTRLASSTPPPERLNRQMTLDIDGGRWLVRAHAAEGYMRSQRSRYPWAILGVGLIFTIIAVVHVRNVSDRVARDVVFTDQLMRANRELGEEIDDRRRAEQAVRRSERKYHSVFETAANLIFNLDPHGVILDCNQRIVQVLGYEPQELAGRDILSLIHPNDQDRVRAVLATMPTGQDRQEEEYRMLHKDGSVRWVRASSATLRDEAGRFIGVTSIVEDITERRLLEEQLRQSQRMEAIGRLAGGVAHDIRNHLTVVRGYAEMLLRRKLIAEEHEDKIHRILESAERSSTVAEQLLTFSRKQNLSPHEINLHEAIAGLLGSLEKLAGPDVTIRLAPDEERGTVRIDPEQFAQAMMNLVTNARDAMPGGGQIEIETGSIEVDEALAAAHDGAKPGPHLLVTIRDSGRGMDTRTLARVFEPFFTTKASEKGTGLGLSMVYGFVRQSGGCIAIDSEPGGGTTVRMCFPRSQASTEWVPAPATDGEANNGKTVLLVEDGEAVRQLAAAILREAGYTVMEAEGVSQAAAVAKQYEGDISLLVTDVVMHGSTGPELVRQLASFRPDTPVLYLTGYGDSVVSRYGLRVSSENVLAKPFSREDLLGRVRGILASHQSNEHRTRFSSGD